MWQTKNSITVILVTILVTMIVISTVHLEPSPPSPGGKRQSGTNSSGKAINSTGSLGGGGGDHGDGQPPVASGYQRVATLGQLETFNANSTGLGDLEGADSFKKMLRRSARPSEREKPPSPGAAADWRSPSERAPANRLRRNSEQLAPRELAARPAAVAAAGDQAMARKLLSLLQVLERSNDEPIEIYRRTGEQLLPGPLDNLGQQLAADGLDDKSNPAQSAGAPLVGEFGSKISLLTMRKVPQLDGQLPVRADGGQFYSTDRLSSATPNAIVIDNKNHEQLVDAILADDADLNYLPRISRAFM